MTTLVVGDWVEEAWAHPTYPRRYGLVTKLTPQMVRVAWHGVVIYDTAGTAQHWVPDRRVRETRIWRKHVRKMIGLPPHPA